MHSAKLCIVRLIFSFQRICLNALILDVLYDLADGSLMSDCPLPCKTTQTETKFLYETKDDNYIDISFSSQVRVTTTDLVRPTLTSFLSEVGLTRYDFVVKLNFRLVAQWASGWVLGQFKYFSSQWIAFYWLCVNTKAPSHRLGEKLPSKGHLQLFFGFVIDFPQLLWIVVDFLQLVCLEPFVVKPKHETSLKSATIQW